MRDEKTGNKYTTLDGKVVREETSNGITVDYFYDNEGKPYKLKVHVGDNTYVGYYVLNQQGDVIAIVESSGAEVVSYRYNAWGKILEETASETSTGLYLGGYNALKYRGYYYDDETGFYYVSYRYYDPVIGRFITPDNISYLGQNGDIISYNLYAYCGNNPTCRRDIGGNAWETVFDIISLGSSIVDVAVSPADPWAWVALIGDVADVAIPFVAGLGEGAKALKAAANATELSEDVVDMKSITENTLAVIKKTAEGLNKGTNTVYISRDADNIIEYVGITNCFGRREKEWEGIRKIEVFVPNLDRQSARYVEQAVISTFGRKRNGGLLSNMINSIAKKKIYNSTYEFFYQNLYL